MKKNIILSTFLLLTISVSVASEYRLGRDYGSLSRPLPIKEDGVVDVVEVFWYGCGPVSYTHLTLPTILLV